MRPYGMRRFRAYDGADIHWAARRGRGRARAEARQEAVDGFEDALIRALYPEGFPPPGMSGSAMALLEAHFRERHASQERGMEAMKAEVALAFRRQGKTGFWLELLGVLPDEES